MAITRLKFETYHSIIGNKCLYVVGEKNLKDETIIRVAIEEYDCNLTEKDLKEMRKNFESLMYKYIN